ncbi:MAG: aromatic amino acid transport family protein [Nanoarchaeota archaeon]
MKGDNFRIFTAIAILIGFVIGAGFLGIPHVVSKSGFAVGAFYIIFLGVVITYLNLAVGEISLRTKTDHQLTGYCSKYLGKNGRRWMLFSMIFGIYGAVLAYLFGVGKSLSFIFFGNLNYALIIGLIIWVVMSFLVSFGLYSLKKVMSYGMIAMLFLIVLISFIHFPEINYGNFSGFDAKNMFVPFGVVLFAYLGFSAMPEIERYLHGRERLMKKSLLYGSLITFIVYFLFTFVMVGVYGKNVPEISTFALGRLVAVLGVITMGTSYLSLSVALRDMYLFDYQTTKKKAWIYTCIAPLILFLIFNYINFDSFTNIISIGGSISGGVAAVLILMMLHKVKREGSRAPEYKIPAPKWLLVFIGIVFVLGIVYEILNILRIV